ncbi:suppressor of disruption of TFIIS-like isoform X3 [Phragmites australis]|uniref:suppressor of disruption of TFIIS-like isoform X3 n=1 Tax=Phragmites australis TaxID=29695 RepID=UPI002D78D37A|nr:suppressor of disruption of TFIIS-like isoform X3 [Phragmites australis]
MAADSPFDCVLVDLDDTLYPGDTGIGLALKRNIDEFLVAKLGVTAERAAAMRVELFRTHGSTLSGLIALGYEVHPDEYHSYVHGRLPYDRIAADPQLARLLQSIPQRKVLFTNSDRAHMKRALQRLSVDEACFDAIVCFETMNPHLFGEAREEHANAARPVVVLKPSVEAIVAAIRVADSNPRRTLFLDDNERNIAAGKALGLRTALVGKRVRSKEADYALENIGNLRRVIPEIWGVAGGESSGQPDLGIDKKGMRSDLESIIQPASIQA